MENYRVSARRACAVIQFRRSSLQFKSRRRDDSVIRKRIKEIALVRVRYGYQRIYVLLRREGWRDKCTGTPVQKGV
jgi:putative transposase